MQNKNKKQNENKRPFGFRIINARMLAPMPSDFKIALQEHEKWLNSDGDTGTRLAAGQFNLCGTDLKNVKLCKADLRNADLSGSDLSGADLRQADLERAKLDNAYLIKTDMRDGIFDNVSFINAQMEGAIARDSYFREAEFRNANLRGTDFNSSNLSRAKFDSANLDGTIFRGAILQDAILMNTKAMICSQLSGSNLAGAKVPEGIHEFKRLTTLTAASRNANRLLLFVLLACFYSWLVIATTKDAGLLTNSQLSPLPIIGTPVPIAGFFVFAPIVLLLIYIYFHLNLSRLWENIAELPAIFPDGSTMDKNTYPWLPLGIVYSRFRLLNSRRPALLSLQNAFSIFLLWYLVPLTLIWFWVRYLPRHSLFWTTVHVVLISTAIIYGINTFVLSKKTLSGDATRPPFFPFGGTGKTGIKYFLVNVLIFVFFIIISLGALNGIHPPQYEYYSNSKGFRLWIPTVLKSIGFNTFADLAEAEISIKPDNWVGDSSQIALVKGGRLYDRNLYQAMALNAFLVRADLRYANLEGAVLDYSDLRNSSMQYVNLHNASVCLANLKDVDLSNAILTGCNLRESNLQCATLISACLSDAILTYANVAGVDWREADLRGTEFLFVKGLNLEMLYNAKNWILADYDDSLLVELRLPVNHSSNIIQRNFAEYDLEKFIIRETDLSDYFLYETKLNGADLSFSCFTKACLTNAALEKANLSFAVMEYADLSSANLNGANLASTNMKNVDLKWSQVSNVNWSYAKLQGADLRGIIGLNLDSLTKAINWPFALFDGTVCERLGLPADHNERVSKKDFHDYVFPAFCMDGSDLDGYDFRGADISKAWELIKTKWRGAKLDSLTVLPQQIIEIR